MMFRGFRFLGRVEFKLVSLGVMHVSSMLIAMSVEDSTVNLWLLLGFRLLSIFIIFLFNLVLVTSCTVSHEVTVRIVSLVVEGWRLVVWNVKLVSGNIMSIVLQIMGSLVSVVKLFVLPLIMDLVDQESVVVGDVSVLIDGWVVVLSEVVSAVAVMSVTVEVQVVVTVVLIIVGVLVDVVLHWLHLENKVTGGGVYI